MASRATPARRVARNIFLPPLRGKAPTLVLHRWGRAGWGLFMALHDNADIRRIVYVCHSKEIGGAELYLEGLIRFTVSGQGQPELICRRDSVLDRWVQGIIDLGVPVHRVDLKRPPDDVSMRRFSRRAALVHLVLAYPTGKYQLTAAMITWLGGGPLVATNQPVVEIGGISMNSLRRAFWRFAFRLYRRLARVNIASSQAGWQSLVRRYGFPEASTELIHNGANLTRFVPITGDERRAIRLAIADELAGRPWPDDILLACTIARFSVQKGLFDLVTAAYEVARHLPTVRFVIAGDGELREQLKARVAEQHLKDWVLFAGARPLAELARWLGAADLFVLSSHYEGMPLSLIEAMAAGCPVVATAVGGVTDVVADDTVGRLVPPKKPDGLAQAAVHAATDSDRRRAMATPARAPAVQAFHFDTCHSKTTAIYQRILT